MKEKELKAVLEELTQLMSDGVHIVDMDGVSFVYNSAMEKIEDTKKTEILGKPFKEAFSHISVSESTLNKALSKKEKTVKYRQTYKNNEGKEIITINTTIPIEIEGKVIAALELSKDITDLRAMADRVIKYRNELPKVRKYTFNDLIGENKKFKKIIDLAKKAATTKVPVFIYGETGTGKELFAQSIHYDGERKDKPFIAQNCAAVPEALFEEILFGTEKGAFTGEVDRLGLFEQANGGTLLLDEVSAMPYDLQSKLLGVLQKDYIRHVGGTKDIPVDVKIIATVNEDPERLIKTGALRKDLYYRLNIVSLEIPSLNERKEDIPLLVDKFIHKSNIEFGKRIKGISKEALDKLMKHNYTGNVRELENIIISSVTLLDGDFLKAENLFLTKGTKVEIDYDPSNEGLDEYIGRVEKNIIKDVLAENNGNISKAANILGIKRQTLQHKIKKMEI